MFLGFSRRNIEKGRKSSNTVAILTEEPPAGKIETDGQFAERFRQSSRKNAGAAMSEDKGASIADGVSVWRGGTTVPAFRGAVFISRGEGG